MRPLLFALRHAVYACSDCTPSNLERFGLGVLAIGGDPSLIAAVAEGWPQPEPERQLRVRHRWGKLPPSLQELRHPKCSHEDLRFNSQEGVTA